MTKLPTNLSDSYVSSPALQVLRSQTYRALFLACACVVISLCFALTHSAQGQAQSMQGEIVKIESVRLWRAPDHTRIVLDLSGPVEHRMFQLKSPDRIVVDIDSAELATTLASVDLKGSPVNTIRSGKTDSGIRLVFEAGANVDPVSFTLAKLADKQDRLVVDLIDKVRPEAVKTLPISKNEAKPVAKNAVPAVPSSGPEATRRFLIAIDAGHGGEDPGASGPRKTREKDVVMKIARELKKKLDKHPSFETYMVRTGDYYIALRERRNKARLAKADLFISIHADAFTHPRAHGASVFALSRSGATSEMARFLASKENEADLIGGVGGVSLDDKDALLAGVLVDLSMNSTLEKSLQVGSEVLKEIGKFTKLHKRSVEQAGFAVLKSPDVPSILVETGFISNPQEERKLRSDKHQKRLAEAIITGVDRFFKTNDPARYQASQNTRSSVIATVAASTPKTAKGRVHTVQSGDTLSAIARQYNQALKPIIQLNKLTDTRLKVGQKIRIPDEQ